MWDLCLQNLDRRQRRATGTSMKVTALTHLIPAADFAREINHVVTVLEAGGYSTAGMDFTDLIARRLGDAFARSLTEKGAWIKNHNWEMKADRSLRIKIYLPREEDVPLVQGIITST